MKKRYDAKFKAKVVLETLREQNTARRQCELFRIKPFEPLLQKAQQGICTEPADD